MEDLTALSEALLPEIERELDGKNGEGRSVLYRAHRVAVRNWLGRYRPLAEMAGEDKVRGFEEAYYHLRSMSALRQALRVKKVSLRVRKRLAVERWRRFEVKVGKKEEPFEAE